MKKHFVGSGILFFLTLSVFVACSPDIKQKYKLKTSTPFSYDHFCNFDSLSGYRKYPRTYEYDTVKKQRVYIFDSIPEGKVTLTFFSLLTNDYRQSVELNKDTTIAFDTTLYSRLKMYDESVDGYPEKVFNLVLQDRDTIYIGMNYYGCLISNEKMKFFKVDTTYRIEITRHQLNSETTVYSMPAKPFEKAFGKYIADVKQSFYQPQGKSSSGKITIEVYPSAYSENLYVRKGDTIYKFPKASGWFEYNTFKSSIEDARQKASGEEVNREMGIQNEKWGTILVKQKNN